ncbi:hypothetical protein HPB50_003569 [Hyalomma asiaticum]|uniref:Uncharacterized protein n=1 Tax=Hyalomma asiaticum TaxID=266040 RepID=A0ACB7SYF1_HYAAI|nr:hypothetical protein HPB50_003569 [Hyalomma asiaticum]
MTTDEGSILAKTVAPTANGSSILTKQSGSVQSRNSAVPKIEKSASDLELASDKKPAAKTTTPGGPSVKIATTAPPPVDAVTSGFTSGPTTGVGGKSKPLLLKKNQRGYETAPAYPGAIAGVVIGLFCSLVGFAVLAFAMAYSGHAKEVADASLACDTEQCHEARKLLDTSGNLTVDPCHNFYDYVCHRWARSGSFLDDVMDDFYSILGSIIMPGELPYPDIYGSHVFFHTYRTCTRFMNSSQDTAALTSVLPRLRKHAGSLHNLSQRDLVTAIVRLSGVSGIDVLFGIGLALYEKSAYPAIKGGRSIRKAFEGLPDFEAHLEAALTTMATKVPAKDLIVDVLKIDDIVNAAFENDSNTRIGNMSAVTEAVLQLGSADWSSLFQKYLRVPHTERFFWSGQNQAENILKVIGANATSDAVQAYLSLQVAAEVLALYFKSRVSVYPNVSERSGDFLDEHLTLMEDHEAASISYPLPVGMQTFAERQIDGALAFSEVLNSIVLSGALISAPILYSATMPTEFNFGTMGSLLAREIAHVFTPASSKEWWDERSQDGFRESTECLRKLYSSFEGNTSRWNVATASKLFALTMAARISLDGFLSGAGGIVGTPLPGLEQPQTSPDAMSTFFRRFCLLTCGHDEPHLSARSRCMIPLSGMPEFADAFRCARGTVMNPDNSCALTVPEQRDLERARLLS